MSENIRNTILRFAMVFVAILLGFLVVWCRIIKIQTVERAEWMKKVANRENNEKPLAAIRGNIYDSEGRLLASSVPQYHVYMDGRVEALHQNNGELMFAYVDSMAMGLSRIVGDQTPAEYRASMMNAYRGSNGKGSIVKLSSARISYTQYKEIKKLPLISRGVYKSGVYFENLNLRVKPFNSLSSRTIGTLAVKDGQAKTGIEKRFDSYLRGKDGVKSRERVAGTWQYVAKVDAVNGADVYTTLDANLIDICENPLRSKLEALQADWGCVVLMEVKTGEIKAMCNLTRAGDGEYYELANHAVTRMEPGSTFKTIALMAALDDGKISMSDSIQVDSLGWDYYGSKHIDAHPRNTTYNIRQALAVSSNIALAKIVTKGYDGSSKKFVRKLKNMGLCDSVDYIIPGAQQALIQAPENDTVTISKMAYGYSVELSPLQMLMFYNGIANDGKMVAPLLVKEVRKGNKVLESYESRVVKNSLCDGKTLEGVRQCLHDVVWDDEYGTASVSPWRTRKAKSDLVAIAGKTGTAQIRNKGYSNRRHRMSFVGYFPEDKPEYSCICVIHGPKGAYDSGMDCGGVVRVIAEKTMAYTGEYVIKDGELVMMVK